jgi:hypothetical protein
VKAFLSYLLCLLAIFFITGCGVPSPLETTRRQKIETDYAEADEELEPGEAEEEAPAIVVTPRSYKPTVYEGDLKPFIVRARASSRSGTQFSAEMAFDGSRRTRWASVDRDKERLEGYFDRPVGVREITIHWERARAADFSVELLNKQQSWIRIANKTDAEGSMDKLTFPKPIAALGVRIACERRATKWGNSIYEVDILGVAEGTPPTNSLIGFRHPARSPLEAREREIAERLLAEAAKDPKTSAGMSDDDFLDLVARRSFDYFWYETNPSNGLTRDRGRNFESSEEAHLASVAAVGFGLSAYVIGAERGWVPRDEAQERVATTLRTFAHGPVRNVRGFFPHFVNMHTGRDASGTEISTIDTALLIAGMITAVEYFRDPEIAKLGRLIFERVDWAWARDGHPIFVTHGLDQRGKFLDAKWGSFTEGILIYLLALGSPTYPLPVASWDGIDRHRGDYGGYEFLVEHGFQSIFRYQYPALWYDFRGKADRGGIDYYDNVARAILAMRQYCIDQAAFFPASYGPDLWGLGAADGPGDRYMIYGFPPGQPYSSTDGTVIPYAIGGSVPFLPQHSIRALRKLYDDYRDMWGKYGFADSVNPTTGFIARDALGLDAGTILLGIENYRSQLIWNLFMRNAWIQRTTRLINWRTRPPSTDPAGPIDLARDYEWKLRKGRLPLPPPDPTGPEWISVAVPDFWENSHPSFADYDGEAMYYIEFDLPAERLSQWTLSGKPVALVMGGVDDMDEAFLNGLKLGETRTGNDLWRIPRIYPVPGTYLKPGRNWLAVRVTDAGGKGGIWMPPVEIGPR